MSNSSNHHNRSQDRIKDTSIDSSIKGNNNKKTLRSSPRREIGIVNECRFPATTTTKLTIWSKMPPPIAQSKATRKRRYSTNFFYKSFFFFLGLILPWNFQSLLPSIFSKKGRNGRGSDGDVFTGIEIGFDTCLIAFFSIFEFGNMMRSTASTSSTDLNRQLVARSCFLDASPLVRKSFSGD